MQILRGTNAGMSFALELAMLAAFSYWGFTVGGGLVAWALAIALPLLGVLVWGAFLAPRSNRRLTLVPGALLSWALFLLAAAALWVTGQTALAIALALIASVNRMLILTWKQW